MEQVSGGTSPRRRSVHGALALKRAADSRAHALVSIIRELRATGFVSRRALANELNRRGVPTAHGGRWHHTPVVRILSRVDHLTSQNSRTHKRLPKNTPTDTRARPLT